MKPLDVIILRSQDIFSDSRVLKYEDWYKRNNIFYRIVGWDRQGKSLQRENTDYYRGIAGFQQGAKGILGRIKWDYFLLRYLLANRKKYRIVHACDFDTVIPALIMKCFGKKVIFDIFDWFSDEVKTGKWYIDKPINFLEKISARTADLVIICEEGRLEQMGVRPAKWLVIPNIPSFTELSSVESKESLPEDGFIKIAYVGGLVENRGLRELIDVVPLFPQIKLTVAGYGSTDISNYIKKAAGKYNNIKFLGKIEYKTALQIMQQADLLYAMYYLENPNHKFAAPNKFYESIFLHKPIITTQGTLVGNMVKKNHSGFVIGEGATALENLFRRLSLNSVKKVQYNMPIASYFMNKLNFSLQEYKSFITYN